MHILKYVQIYSISRAEQGGIVKYD